MLKFVKFYFFSYFLLKTPIFRFLKNIHICMEGMDDTDGAQELSVLAQARLLSGEKVHNLTVTVSIN